MEKMIQQSDIDLYNELIEYTEKLIKRDEAENKKVKGRKFKLYRTSEYGRAIGITMIAIPIALRVIGGVIDNVTGSNFFNNLFEATDGNNVDLAYIGIGFASFLSGIALDGLADVYGEKN